MKNMKKFGFMLMAAGALLVFWATMWILEAAIKGGFENMTKEYAFYSASWMFLSGITTSPFWLISFFLSGFIMATIGYKIAASKKGYHFCGNESCLRMVPPDTLYCDKCNTVYQQPDDEPIGVM